MSFNTANIDIFQPQPRIANIDISQPQPRVVNIEVNTNNRVVSVNGKIGSVVLTKNDIGLNNVENVSILGVSGVLQGEIDDIIVQSSGFYPNSNPSGFITGVDLSNYVQKSETGSFITADQTGVFYTADNPSGFITGWSTDNLVNGEYNVVLSGDGALIVPGKITVPNFSGGKILSVSPYDSIESFASVNDIALLQNGFDLGGRISIDESLNISIQNVGSGYVDGLAIIGGGTRLVITTSQNGWTFLSNGTIVFPDMSIQSSAYTGIDLSSYVLNTETGSFITADQTGIFYTADNPSGYITGVDLSPYVLASETGSFITADQTGAFYAADNPSGFITGVDLSSYALQSSVDSILNDNTYVRTTGNQVINDTKYFDGVHINNLYVDGTQTIVNTETVNVGSNYINLNATGGARDAGLFINLNESGIFTGGAYIGWDIPSNTWRIGTGVSGADLSSLDYIASQSWVADNYYLSSNPSGYITGVNLEPYVLKTETGSFLTTAGGVISGNLTVNNITVQSQVQYSSGNTVKVYQYYNTETNSLDTVFI